MACARSRHVSARNAPRLHYVPVDVDQIVGSFVVEIGVRQVWPFLGLCDNRPTPARETRLYIDTSWTVESLSSVSGAADDDVAWLTAAAGLNGQTIERVRVDDDGTLRLATDAGISLIVSGEAEPYSVGEAWRLSGWRPV